MLQKHEVCSLIHGITNQELVGLFKEAATLIKDVRVVWSELQSYQRGETEDWDLVDALEPYANVEIDNIAKFHAWKSSNDDIVNRYLDRVYYTIPVYAERLSYAIDCVFQLTDEEIENLIRCAYDVISGMVFLLVSEFGLYEYGTGTADDGDPDIDEVFNEYCKSTMTNPAEFVKSMLAAAEEFRVKINLFDSYPEYENLFYAAMGPDIIAVDPELLTVDMVAAVVTGEISPEELIAQLNAIRAEEWEQQ